MNLHTNSVSNWKRGNRNQIVNNQPLKVTPNCREPINDIDRVCTVKASLIVRLITCQVDPEPLAACYDLLTLETDISQSLVSFLLPNPEPEIHIRWCLWPFFPEFWFFWPQFFLPRRSSYGIYQVVSQGVSFSGAEEQLRKFRMGIKERSITDSVCSQFPSK